jgi:Lar family restriction alleviation protein
MANLKPCPFCGSDNIEEANKTIPFVVCKDCEAFGPRPIDYSIHDDIKDWEYEKKRIHAAWNRRHKSLLDSLAYPQAQPKKPIILNR